MKSSALPVLDALGRLLLAFAFPIALCLAGASWTIMLTGIITWALAVACKPTVYGLLAKAIPLQSIIAKSARAGLASAVLELGSAAMYFAFTWRTLSVLDVFAFGAAIGSFEVIFTVALGIYEMRKQKGDSFNSEDAQFGISQTEQPRPGIISFIGLIERTGAAIGHIGSRGMVYAAFAISSSLMAILAVILFGIVDGLAFCGILCKWNWLDPKIFYRFYGAVWSIGLLELALFFFSLK